MIYYLKKNLPYARKLDNNEDNFIMKLNGAELVCPLSDKDIIKGYFVNDPLANIQMNYK